jgi:hypothetical protein
MDWFIRHRVAGKSSVEVDNYMEKLCTYFLEDLRSSVPVRYQRLSTVNQGTSGLLRSLLHEICNYEIFVHIWPFRHTRKMVPFLAGGVVMQFRCWSVTRLFDLESPVLVLRPCTASQKRATKS